MSKEEIAITAASQKGAAYDEVAKENLHYPKLIAPILKAVVPEYKKYSIDDIVQFIAKETISDDPIDDVSVIAGEMGTELNSISEKLIRYDSRFKAINPDLSSENITFYLHIDLEVQNTYKPSSPDYPIVKRGIYYGAREISSQLGTLTHATDYGVLEKTYSIWICNNVPEKLQNTVSSYRIVKADEIGITDEPDQDYDLLNVIIIRRGNKESSADIFDYLTAFFQSSIDGINKYVNIKDDEEIMKGVKKMSGLGESLYQQGTIDVLIDMVKDKIIELSEAAKRAHISEADFAKLLEEKKK